MLVYGEHTGGFIVSAPGAVDIRIWLLGSARNAQANARMA